MHNIYSEEVHKIALRANDNKWMQTVDPIETYGYWTNKDLVSEKRRLNLTI